MASVTDFIENFEYHKTSLLHLHPMRKNFSVISLAADANSPFSQNTLYIDYASRVEEQQSSYDGCILFLLKDKEIDYTELKKHNTLILCFPAEENDIHDIYNDCNKWLQDFHTYLEASYKLTQIVINNPVDTTDCFVSAAAEIIHNPLLLLDGSGQIISASNTYEVEEKYWIENIERGYCSYEQMAEIQALSETSPVSSRPLHVHSTYSTNRMAVCQLTENQEFMGYLIIFESSTPFSKTNKQIIQLIQKCCARLIFNHYRMKDQKNELALENLILDCLSGKLHSYGNYVERTKNTIFEKPSTYHVIIIDIKDFKALDPRQTTLRSTFEKLFSNAFMFLHNGNVTCVVEVGNDVSLLDVLKKEQTLFEEKSLRFGISDIFTTVFEIAAYYQQAYNALRLGTTFHPQDMFYYYNNYKFYDLIYTLNPKIDFTKYLDNKLFEIYTYDKENNTEYYKTIYYYVFCNQNLLTTAGLLHVHKNTIFYRISKAKTLFQLNFDDGESMFQLFFSYQLKKALDNQNNIENLLQEL